MTWSSGLNKNIGILSLLKKIIRHSRTGIAKPLARMVLYPWGNQDAKTDTDNDLIAIHNCVKATGEFNFMGAQICVPSQLLEKLLG